MERYKLINNTLMVVGLLSLTIMSVEADDALTSNNEAHKEQKLPASESMPAGDVLLGPQPGNDLEVDPPTNPLLHSQEAREKGRKLFVGFNCYGCHGGRAGGGMGPSLRDNVWLYGSLDADIFDSIANGRPHGMPAWGKVVPEKMIWQLTTYIKSLGTDNEPDAPPKNPVYP